MMSQRFVNKLKHISTLVPRNATMFDKTRTTAKLTIFFQLYETIKISNEQIRKKTLKFKYYL